MRKAGGPPARSTSLSLLNYGSLLVIGQGLPQPTYPATVPSLGRSRRISSVTLLVHGASSASSFSRRGNSLTRPQKGLVNAPDGALVS